MSRHFGLRQWNAASVQPLLTRVRGSYITNSIADDNEITIVDAVKQSKHQVQLPTKESSLTGLALKQRLKDNVWHVELLRKNDIGRYEIANWKAMTPASDRLESHDVFCNWTAHKKFQRTVTLSPSGLFQVTQNRTGRLSIASFNSPQMPLFETERSKFFKFSNDSRYCVINSWANNENSKTSKLTVVELATGAIRFSKEFDKPLNHVIFSPKAKYVLTKQSESSFLVVDWKRGAIVSESDIGRFMTIEFCTDSRILVRRYDGTYDSVDIATGQTVCKLELPFLAVFEVDQVLFAATFLDEFQSPIPGTRYESIACLKPDLAQAKFKLTQESARPRVESEHVRLTATSLFDAKNFYGALLNYQSIPKDNRSPFEMNRIGTCLFRLRRYAEAADAFESAFEQHKNKSILLSIARSYFQSGQYDKAVLNYELAIADNQQVNTLYARSLFQTGKQKVAFTEISKLIEARPDYAANYYWRGHMFAETGNLEKAKADFETALKLSPGAFPPYRELVRVLILTDQHDEARNMLNKYLPRYYDEEDSTHELFCWFVALLPKANTLHSIAFEWTEQHKKLLERIDGGILSRAALAIRLGKTDAREQIKSSPTNSSRFSKSYVMLLEAILLVQNSRQKEATALFEKAKKATERELLQLKDQEGEFHWVRRETLKYLVSQVKSEIKSAND